MAEDQGPQSHVQSLDNNEIVQNQQQLNESIENDKSMLKQLQQQYQNKIQDYFKNLDQEVKKEKIKKFMEDQFKTYFQNVEKIFQKQCDKFKSEIESHTKQIKQLTQTHQQEKNQKNQEIQELTQKYNEVNNQFILSSCNDNNICSKLNQMNNILEKTFVTTIQANQQLDIQSLDQMKQQIHIIKQSITGNTETEINNLQIQLNEKEQKIQQLEKEIEIYQNQQRNNQSSLILTKKIEEFEQKHQNQSNQTDQINQKANSIVEICKELNKLNTYLSNENQKQKIQFEEEKSKAINKQLEGCFKLQDRSLLYIQLGLKIFQQYYQSHIQDGQKIKSQIDRLNKFHQNYQKKENFKLKDLQEVEQFYIKQELELKALFDDSLKEYKDLIYNITKGRRDQ